MGKWLPQMLVHILWPQSPWWLFKRGLPWTKLPVQSLLCWLCLLLWWPTSNRWRNRGLYIWLTVANFGLSDRVYLDQLAGADVLRAVGDERRAVADVRLAVAAYVLMLPTCCCWRSTCCCCLRAAGVSSVNPINRHSTLLVQCRGGVSEWGSVLDQSREDWQSSDFPPFWSVLLQTILLRKIQ